MESATIPTPPSTGLSGILLSVRISKGAKIKNRYNQVPHLTQDTSGDVTNSQLDTTNESQEVSPFPAGHHKGIANTRQNNHKRSTKEVPPWNNQNMKNISTLYRPCA